LVIVEDQVGIKLPLRNGENQIEHREWGQQCPGLLDPVGLAQREQQDHDKPPGNTAQGITERAIDLDRGAVAGPKGADIL
jgi:hypothetical protein